MLSEFAARRAQPIEVRAEWDEQEHVFMSPPNLDAALNRSAEHPDATIVAGATDIGVRINKSLTIPRKILDLNRVDELDGRERSKTANWYWAARASWTAIEEICESRGSRIP